MVIAINKWDLIEDKKSNTINKFEKMIEHEIPFLNYVPKIYISAVTHQRLNNIFTKVEEVYSECTKRVSTGLLNKVINEAYALNPPQTIRNKRLKIMYSTQATTHPPTFILFANNEALLDISNAKHLNGAVTSKASSVSFSLRLDITQISSNFEYFSAICKTNSFPMPDEAPVTIAIFNLITFSY